MADLILSEEQTALLQKCNDQMTVRDAYGRKVGELRPCEQSCERVAGAATVDELAEIKRRMNSNDTWHTTAEVLQRLESVEVK